MKNLEEIKEELIDRFKELKVDGKKIGESKYFDDFARMGFYLSTGKRGVIKGTPLFKNALKELDEDMIKRCGKWYSQKDRTLEHFQQQEQHYKNQINKPLTKDRDYSKLLTNALGDFESAHGFLVAGERLPNYAGFVYGHVFKEALRLKQHWKDVGAGADHGEYTHRLQWYVLIKTGAIKSVSRYQEAEVFQAIEPWQKGKTNLWTFLFDRAKDGSAALGGVDSDKLDFRCPENLNLWLVGDEDPEFCPVLRAFLRARMAKRKSTYDLVSYLAKKLRITEKEAEELKEEMDIEEINVKKKWREEPLLNPKPSIPSYRINFPENPKKGELSKFAK